MSRTPVRLFALVALALSGPAAAEGDGTGTLSPYFFVEGGSPETDRLPLNATSVDVRISGVIADVTVKQTYENEGSRPIHARYVFPASTRAAVHGLVMTVGNRRVSAVIREREEAAATFAAAKKAGKNAALLEQSRPNVFTMNVANIMPGQTIEVELRYTELLVPESGVYEFVYPTVVGPRYSTVPESGAPATDRFLASPYTHEGEAPTYGLDIRGTVTAGLPIRDVVCPSHVIGTRFEDPARVRFQLGDTERDGGNRDFVLRYRLDGDRIQAGLLLRAGEDENEFLMMLEPPRRVTPERIPPREYVFVVDVSGSMRGFPLDTAKTLMRGLLRDLRPVDRFNVLFFSGGSRLWSEQSRFATEANVEDAIGMLGDEDGGGGTELYDALRRALALPREGAGSRSLIVVTDGYIAAERQAFNLIREHLDEANVFAFGIGRSVNRHLIEGIARAGLGEPFVVLEPSEAREMADRFRTYVSSPVLTGIRVSFDGFDAYDVEPASVPDLLAERPVVVCGKWRGAPVGRIVVEGTTGHGPYRKVLSAEVAPDPANEALRILWARTRIASLDDFGDPGGGEDVKPRLVELGLTYNLLTRFTSFVAVDEVIVNDLGPGEDVAQPLPLPAGVPDTALPGMGVGSEPGLLVLMAAMTLVLVGSALRRRARSCA